MRPCFNFKATAAEATLSIYDEIGFWGVQAKDFRTQLDAVSAKTLNVEINSPGGDVFAGLAIYNMLKSSGKEIVVKVMGVAASAASLIAMAGDKIQMPKNTFMMVHNPWGVAIGNSSEMRETADVLDKIGDSLLATYVNKTGLKDEEVKGMLAKDTWLTADEALAKGFATEVTDDIKAQAVFDMDRADLPDHIKAIYAAAKGIKPEPEPKPAPTNPVIATQVHDAAVAAGLKDHAEFLGAACVSMEEATTRIQAALEITQICAYAKQPHQATTFIREGKTVAEAREAMVKAMAAAEEHTSTAKPADTSANRPQAKTSDEVFAERNARKGAKRKKD